MNSSYLSEMDTSVVEAKNSSVAVLLEKGLRCVQQGHHLEGIAFFSLARERLTANNEHISELLDAFIQDHMRYWQAQQDLQLANQRLAEVQATQQTRISSIEKLLPTLQEKVSSSPSPVHTSSIESHTPTISQSPKAEGQVLSALHFTCFGYFEVKRCDQVVTLCSNRNGQAILRYLVAQANHRATMDTLMALFWPDDEPEVAHHKLQVAISALRRSLNNGYTNDQGGGYIRCKDGVYQLNPAVIIHSDVDEFLEYYRAGQQLSGEIGIQKYEAACNLYKGPFLTEDLYVDWPLIQREQMSQAYLSMCHKLSEHYFTIGSHEIAAQWANAILKENRCDEMAHRQLIRIYAATGHRNEALRQFQHCEHILSEEMGASPMPETIQLFHEVLNNEYIPIIFPKNQP